MTANSRGFTLVELLVGITLLALISTLLVGSLRLSFRGAEAIARQADALEERQLVSNFLRRQIETAQPLAFASGSRFEVAFAGRPDRLEFAAAMPGRHGPGGLYLVRLAVESEDDGEVLVLVRRSYTAGPAAFDFGIAAERTVLLRGLTRAAFAYADEDGGWRADWSGQEVLPELVRIELETAGTPWPPLVVVPRLGRGDR